MSDQLAVPSGTAPPTGSLTTDSGGATSIERALAVLALMATGIRLPLPMGLTSGVIVAVVTLPLWLRSVPRYAGGRTFQIAGVVTAISGVALTVSQAPDHTTSQAKLVSSTLLLFSILGGVGVVLWARSLLPEGHIAVAFGLGMLAGVSPGTGLYEVNPWRFGYSVAVTVVVLGICRILNRRWIDLTAVIAFAGLAAVTDARSSFGLLMLCALILLWQARPRTDNAPRSSALALLVLAGLGFAIFNLGQALVLEGYLGEETQQRSLAQVATSGSLLFGGRPEMFATLALMREFPGGFGSGTFPTLSELGTAKNGLAASGYQPNNNYVERYMFGTGYELHSVAGDIWANFGIFGLFFAGLILVITLKTIGRRVVDRACSGLILYLAAKTVWNTFFSPLYSSTPLLILFVGLALPLISNTVTSLRVPGSPNDRTLRDDR